MTKTLRTYSPQKTSMTAFEESVEGFSEGTYVSMSRDTPSTSKKVGADGSIQRTFSPDRSGTIEVTLQQNSPTHKYFSRIFFTQDQLGEPIYGNFVVMEPSGSFLAVARYVHIMEAPTMTLGKESEDRTWTLGADQIIFSEEAVGGQLSDSELARITSAVDSAVQNSQSFQNSL